MMAMSAEERQKLLRLKVMSASIHEQIELLREQLAEEEENGQQDPDAHR